MCQPGRDREGRGPGKRSSLAGAFAVRYSCIRSDLDGAFRFHDDLMTPDSGLGTAPIVDMGAYEFQ